MKWNYALSLLAAAALGVGCADTLQERRIGIHRDNFESSSREERAYILEKRVVRGMTVAQVYMARGVPDTIERLKGSPAVEERWIYRCPRDEKLVVEFQRGTVKDVRVHGP